MKNVMLGLALAMAVAGSAVAADLPSRTAAPAPYFATASQYSWTGFYAGATVGALRADSELEVPGTTFSQKVKPNGFSVGGFAGFQQQFGSIVAGAEADVDYNKADKSVDLGGAVLNAKAPWAGSVRARLGYTLTERTLVYATGGLAASNGFEYSIVAPGFAQSWKGSKLGYTVGAGVDYAFTDHVFGRLEGRYTNFGKQDTVVAGTPVSFKDDSFAVKAGVGYKF